MKKYLVFPLLAVLSVLVFSGCADAEQSSSEQTKDDTSTKQEQEKPEEVKAEKEAEQEKREAAKQEEEQQEPQYKISEVSSIVPIDNAEEQVALLTFDDAPDKHALEIANSLKEQNAPAIFFVNGHFLTTDEEKETLKKIYDMGFAIGNHTYSHANLNDLTQEETKEEILKVNELVEEITGEKPAFFRAPFGENTDYSRQLAEEEGMAVMNWTYGYDWESQYQDKDALAEIMVNTELLGNGANLLMHDREWTAAAVPEIVEGLRDKGFTLVNPDAIERPS
ncbi:Peptidoglycan/xylan/chitin deacetylase, PgdA/CDA1 family [Terribacillus aidingensis]|uniref:Peptidoglycan/xylan/chitin deacetylase, PgdA/CDA1 family n=1 Tax=Terribacillus aidingensis TaxID=586416 RepID=A0A285NIE3_9BACI|nr:polysaccharide deacetylase family protein [Terribacillus aidingensis]SNZ09260.1 Peptidoglycan/xylan/chitin deacetylase, PgdA/CDA1 family [Terribacillus aidingensis]